MSEAMPTATTTTVNQSMTVATEAARRALFSAASRVLRHHAAALEQKVAKLHRADAAMLRDTAPTSIGN